MRDDVVLAEIKKGKSVKNRLVKKKKKKTMGGCFSNFKTILGLLTK